MSGAIALQSYYNGHSRLHVSKLCLIRSGQTKIARTRTNIILLMYKPTIVWMSDRSENYILSRKESARLISFVVQTCKSLAGGIFAPFFNHFWDPLAATEEILLKDTGNVWVIVYATREYIVHKALNFTRDKAANYFNAKPTEFSGTPNIEVAVTLTTKHCLLRSVSWGVFEINISSTICHFVVTTKQ